MFISIGPNNDAWVDIELVNGQWIWKQDGRVSVTGEWKSNTPDNGGSPYDYAIMRPGDYKLDDVPSVYSRFPICQIWVY